MIYGCLAEWFNAATCKVVISSVRIREQPPNVGILCAGTPFQKVTGYRVKAVLWTGVSIPHIGADNLISTS